MNGRIVGIAGAILLVTLVPLAPAQPIAQPCTELVVHSYIAGPVQQDQEPMLVPPVGCPEGTDAEYGIGGVFLSADHHGKNVCIADNYWADASYSIQVDGNGDGIISPDNTPEDHATPFEAGCNRIPFEPGADGGWWILLGPSAWRGTVLSG